MFSHLQTGLLLLLWILPNIEFVYFASRSQHHSIRLSVFLLVTNKEKGPDPILPNYLLKCIWRNKLLLVGQQLVGCLLTKPTKALLRFSAYRWDSEGTSLPPKYDMPRNSGPENYEQTLLIRTALAENNTHQEWVQLSKAEQTPMQPQIFLIFLTGPAPWKTSGWPSRCQTPLAIISWALFGPRPAAVAPAHEGCQRPDHAL